MLHELSFGSKRSITPNNNKKRSHTQLDSRKQVIAFQDRVITINIKEAQHPPKCTQFCMSCMKEKNVCHRHKDVEQWCPNFRPCDKCLERNVEETCV